MNSKRNQKPFFPRTLSPFEAAMKCREAVRRNDSLEALYTTLALMGYEGDDAEDVLDLGNIAATVEVRNGSLLSVAVNWPVWGGTPANPLGPDGKPDTANASRYYR